MKQLFSAFCALILALSLVPAAFADKPVGFDGQGNENAWSNSGCAKIPGGTILASNGDVIKPGFDQYGYNYQAHEFNGTYDSVDRVLDDKYWGSIGDYVDDNLNMAWSDEWLSNVDCNGDNKLDRGLINGQVTGVSAGWLTNHVEGDYDGGHYTYFVKIGYFGPGSPLWGSYDVLQEVYNDPVGGWHGVVTYVSPGLGHFLERSQPGRRHIHVSD